MGGPKTSPLTGYGFGSCEDRRLFNIARRYQVINYGRFSGEQYYIKENVVMQASNILVHLFLTKHTCSWDFSQNGWGHRNSEISKKFIIYWEFVKFFGEKNQFHCEKFGQKSVLFKWIF